MASCVHLDEHLDVAADPDPLTPGCDECTALGWHWVHLRKCLNCGHVGCCDTSRGKHADEHYRKTDHPVMRSFSPGETWRWCYVDEVLGF